MVKIILVTGAFTQEESPPAIEQITNTGIISEGAPRRIAKRPNTPPAKALIEMIGMQNLFVINTALTQRRRRVYLTALIVTFWDVSLGLACFLGIGAAMMGPEVCERLDIGDRVVKSPAQAPINNEFVVALFQPELYGEHRVRIVFMDRMPDNILRLRNISERIKIPDNEVGIDTARLPVAAVRGNDKIVFFPVDHASRRHGAEDVANSHNNTSIKNI